MKCPIDLVTCPSDLVTCPSDKITCPNSDPGFNKIIGNRTPKERSFLFVICVITRALLYYGVYMYRDEPWTRWLVGALSLFSIFQLSRPTENRQWWSKKFQLVMAVLVLFSAIAIQNTKAMPTFLFISLLGGVLQRIQIDMC